jgi:hypothetical protein
MFSSWKKFVSVCVAVVFFGMGIPVSVGTAANQTNNPIISTLVVTAGDLQISGVNPAFIQVANKITQWTTPSAGGEIAYTTFTSSGPDVASAVGADPGEDVYGATTNTLTLIVGHQYEIEYNLTLTSGDAPYVLNAALGLGSTALSSGANTITFTAQATSGAIKLFNGTATNFSCTFNLYDLTVSTALRTAVTHNDAVVVLDNLRRKYVGFARGVGVMEGFNATLITNGDMELDSNWSDFNTPTLNQRSSEQAHGGTYSRKVTANEATGIISDNFAVVKGGLYDVSNSIFGDGSKKTTLRIREVAAGSSYYSPLAVSDTGYAYPAAWITEKWKFTASVAGSGHQLRVYSGTGQNANTFYADDMVVRLQTAPSSTGITIASSPSPTGTQSWGVQDAAFDFTAATGLQIVSSTPYGRAIVNQVVTAGTVHLDTTATAMMFKDASTTELVTNGGFDSNTNGWSTLDSTIASVAGGESGNCLELTRTAGTYQAAIQVAIPTTTGKRYKASVYVKSGTSGAEDVDLLIQDGLGVNIQRTRSTTSGSWVKLTCYFIATRTAIDLLLLKRSATAGTMLFDTASVVEADDYSMYAVSAAPAKYIAQFNGGTGSAWAYVGAVGGGESLDTNIFAGFDFTSGWTPVSATGVIANRFTTSSSGGVSSTAMKYAAGKIYKSTLAGSTDNGVVVLRDNTNDSVMATLGAGVLYRTGFGAGGTYVRNASGGTTTITTLSSEKMIDIPITGVTLFTDAALTTRGINVRTGFDANSITTLRIMRAY